MSHQNFMFVAGDPSGDQNTAPIIRRLRERLPQCRCYGVGGPKMQHEGFESLLPFEEFNRMGYVEVLTHISFFVKAKKQLVSFMRTHRPSILVCVDFSGFNTPLMHAAHKLGIPVLWYIAPKIWAWKKKKHTGNLQRSVSHVAAIFPFEVDMFKPFVPGVTFVGNPLVEYIETMGYSTKKLEIEDLRHKKQIRLALVPGSRQQEILSMLPVMLKTCDLLQDVYPQVTATISRCGHIPDQLYQQILAQSKLKIRPAFFEGPLEELYMKTDCALVTSGTATLQTALMGIPMVILYKTSFLTYQIFKAFIKGIKHIGLPNIIAGEEVVPELIQAAMTPSAIMEVLTRYIENPEEYSAVVRKLVSLKESLGSLKPSEEVSRLIIQVSGIETSAV